MALSVGRQWIATHGLASGRAGAPGGYRSPFLLEIAHSGTFAKYVATGTLTANAPGNQVVSCSRAASAYCLGNDGLLHLLGANTVRVEPAGLLREGASTNLIPQSSNLANAAWTTTNVTVTANTADVLAPDGTQTAAKIVTVDTTGATANSLFNNSASATGTPAGNKTLSVWLRTLSGSVTWYIANYDGTTLHSKQVTVTSSWQRFTFTYNDAGGSVINVAFGIQVGFGTPDLQAGQPAATIYMWGPQMENLAFATSYIPTTSAAASRDADVITVPSPLNPSNPGTWRMAGTYTPLGSWQQTFAVDGASVFMALGTNTANNTARLVVQTTSAAQFDVTDNVGGFLALTLPGSFDNSSFQTQAVRGVSTAGVLTGSPGGGSVSGAGTGTITTQPATITLCAPGGLTTFGFWGHATDLVVHNA